MGSSKSKNNRYSQMLNPNSRGRPRKASKSDLSNRAMKIYGEYGISNISFNEKASNKKFKNTFSCNFT